MNGSGVYESYLGEVYKGYWEAGLKHGQGQFKSAKGE